MKSFLSPSIEKYRIKTGEYASTKRYGMNGAFQIPYKKMKLNIIISDQIGWDHISVSVDKKQRTPTWKEMCFVKDIFFSEEEIALQYHPKKSDYINDHDHVLHLWRPQKIEILMPPKVFV